MWWNVKSFHIHFNILVHDEVFWPQSCTLGKASAELSHPSFHLLLGYVNFGCTTLWLHQPFWLNGAWQERDSTGFLQPLLCSAGIKVASQLSQWVHSCTLDQSAGGGQSSSGCQPICLTWLLKSMIICSQQVWFAHERAEIEEAI